MVGLVAGTWREPRFRTSQLASAIECQIQHAISRIGVGTLDAERRRAVARVAARARAHSSAHSAAVASASAAGFCRRSLGKIVIFIAFLARGAENDLRGVGGIVLEQSASFQRHLLARISRMSTMSPGLKDSRFNTVLCCVCEYSPLIRMLILPTR